MALYAYQAFSKDGKKTKGQIDASSLQQARDLLSKRGFYITSLELAFEGKASSGWYKKLFEKKVTLKEKILFTKQLSVLLNSGIPLLQALELLVDQFEGQLRSILINVKDNVKEGKSLAEGLSKYPKTFDTIYVQLVRAGEATGKLEPILDRLSTNLERSEELQKKIKGALSYPIIQLCVILGVVGFLLAFVVPKLTGLFASQGQALPLPTRILLAISNFVTGHYIILLIIIILLVSGFIYLKSQPWGQLFLDKLKLKLPLIKYFTKTSAVVQFSTTLGMLLESGVNLSQALDIVSNIISNKVLTHTLMTARDKIIKEGKIAQYLSETDIFPKVAIYLLKTGEESGELGKMLLVVGSNYETELSDLADSLTEKLTPIMMIAMALIVGFVVISIALPIMNMSSLAGV